MHPLPPAYRIECESSGEGGDVFEPHDAYRLTYSIIENATNRTLLTLSGGEPLEVTLVEGEQAALAKDSIGIRRYSIPDEPVTFASAERTASWVEVFDITELYELAPRQAQAWVTQHKPPLQSLPLQIGSFRVETWSALDSVVCRMLAARQAGDLKSLYVRLLGTAYESEVGRSVSRRIEDSEVTVRSSVWAFYAALPCADGFGAIAERAEAQTAQGAQALELLAARLWKCKGENPDADDERSVRALKAALVHPWFYWPEQKGPAEKAPGPRETSVRRIFAMRGLATYDREWLVENAPAIERAGTGRWEAVLWALSWAEAADRIPAAALAVVDAGLLDPLTLGHQLKEAPYRHLRPWVSTLERLAFEKPSRLSTFLEAASMRSPTNTLAAVPTDTDANGRIHVRLYECTGDRLTWLEEVILGGADLAFARARLSDMGLPVALHDGVVWRAEEKAFTVWNDNQLAARMERGRFRFSHEGPQVPRSHIRAVEPFLSGDWVVRGVRLILKSGETRDVVRDEDPSPQADPTYNYNNLLFDTAWMTSFGRALAEWLEVPWRDRRWPTTTLPI